MRSPLGISILCFSSFFPSFLSPIFLLFSLPLPLISLSFLPFSLPLLFYTIRVQKSTSVHIPVFASNFYLSFSLSHFFVTYCTLMYCTVCTVLYCTVTHCIPKTFYLGRKRQFSYSRPISCRVGFIYPKSIAGCQVRSRC